MKGRPFKSWFRKIISLVEPGSVIVMANVPYHNMKIGGKKFQIDLPTKLQLLTGYEVWEYPGYMFKVEFLEQVNNIEYRYKYKIDEFATKKKFAKSALYCFYLLITRTILIELARVQVKDHVVKNNKNI